MSLVLFVHQTQLGTVSQWPGAVDNQNFGARGSKKSWCWDVSLGTLKGEDTGMSQLLFWRFG